MAKGVLACREDCRDGGELAVVVVNTKKAGDVDVNALMDGWEWPEE